MLSLDSMHPTHFFRVVDTSYLVILIVMDPCDLKEIRRGEGMKTLKQHLSSAVSCPFVKAREKAVRNKDPASVCCLANSDLQLSLKEPHPCRVLPLCNLQVANGLSHIYSISNTKFE